MPRPIIDGYRFLTNLLDGTPEMGKKHGVPFGPVEERVADMERQWGAENIIVRDDAYDSLGGLLEGTKSVYLKDGAVRKVAA